MHIRPNKEGSNNVKRAGSSSRRGCPSELELWGGSSAPSGALGSCDSGVLRCASSPSHLTEEPGPSLAIIFPCVSKPRLLNLTFLPHGLTLEPGTQPPPTHWDPTQGTREEPVSDAQVWKGVCGSTCKGRGVWRVLNGPRHGCSPWGSSWHHPQPRSWADPLGGTYCSG